MATAPEAISVPTLGGIAGKVEEPVPEEATLPLRKNRDFRLLWASSAISGSGSSVSTVVVPILAVAVLKANPTEMALLGAMGMLPALVLFVPAAMVAETVRARIRVVASAQVILGCLVFLIPLLWWAKLLTVGALLAIIGCKAIVGVFSGATSSPLLKELLPRKQLIEANGTMNGTSSASDIAGQAIGGGLLAVLAAPVILVVDAVSFLVGAVFTSRVRMPPQPPAERPPGEKKFSLRVVGRIGAGLVKRVDVWCLMAIALSNGITEAIFVIFAIRTLHVHPDQLGLLIAAGAIGGVAGGFSVGWVSARFGRWTVPFALALTILSLAPIPFVHGGAVAYLSVVNLELFGAFGGTVVVAAVFGDIQGRAAPGTIARTMALAHNTLQVAALVGLFLGALVAHLATARVAMTTSLLLLVALSLPLCALVGTSSRGTAGLSAGEG